MKKRIFLAFFTLCFLIALCAMPVGAETTEVASGTCGTNLTWTLDSEGTLTISGEGDMYDYEEGQAPWKQYELQQNEYVIKEILIGSQVTSIGNYAFVDCLGVISVTIPASIVSIGEYAYSTNGLLHILFEGDAPVISENAFTHVYARVRYPRMNDTWTAEVMLDYGGSLTWAPWGGTGNCGETLSWSLDANGVLSILGIGEMPQYQIENYAPWYEYRSEITSVIIEEGVTNISAYAFYGLDYVTTVQIPASVIEINSTAFLCGIYLDIEVATDSTFFCTDDAGVLYSKDMTELVAAQGCDEDTYEIPAGVKVIGEYAFGGPVGYNNITVPDSVVSLGDRAFASTQLKTVTFLGDAPSCSDTPMIFEGANVMVYYPGDNESWTAEIRNRLASDDAVVWAPIGSIVGDGTYSDWVLTEDGTLTFYGYTTVNGERLSKYKDLVKSVVVEEGATTIYGFTSYTNLRSVSLPSTITEIGNGAFGICTNLTEINFPENLITIWSNSFYDCVSLTEVHIPASVTEFGARPFGGCVNLTGIWVDEASETFANDEYGVLFSADMTKLEEAPGMLEGSYVIPNTVNFIDFGAFDSCQKLTSVVIPEGVTSIQMETFLDCTALETVVIPDSVTYIDMNAFKNCSALESITIPAGVQYVYAGVFANCTSLSTITFEGDAPSIGDFVNVFDGVTATAYYPANNETWTEEVMQNYGGTITWVPYGSEPDYTVTYTNASLSLAGDIGVNYYAQLSENIVADEGAYMQFTIAGETQIVPLSNAIYDADNGTYRFSCKVAARQMTENIVGQMYLSDGTGVGEAKVYSVKAYCDAAIPIYNQYEAHASLVDMLEAMLNYGGYSQVQFGYNTDNLANADLTDTTLPEITADTVAAYAHGATGSESGISVSSVSLLLESTTTIRFYFDLEEGKSIEDYTFYVDGVEATPVQSAENTYYVDKANVAAKDLDEMATVTVGGLTVKYCGLSYVRQVAVLYPTYYSESLVNVAKALYAYNQAANAYFGA